MFKESRVPAFARKALALACSVFVSGAFAQQTAATIELDVILRDFPVDHYGFEMFDSDRNTAGECAGSNPSQANAQAQIPSNGICVSGSEYVPCSGTISQSGSNWVYPNQLMYGEYSEACGVVNGKKKRGYKSGPDMESGCSGGEWQNPVFVTKGMVRERLDYSQCPNDLRGEPGSVDEALKGRLCARPWPANGACYGANLHEWFTDGGAAKTFEDLMTLNRVGNSNVYQIKYDYNTTMDWGGWGSGPDRGYFPLDAKDGTYDKQSLNIWCGAHYPDAPCKDETGIQYWRNGATARRYVNEGKVTSNLFHNYGFTMAGSAEFKYDISKPDIFEFVGDDDMWIFIDGTLAVDLGGTHLAAPAKINIQNYGQKQGNYGQRPGDVWEDGSMHVINFYYADRQTDGSNMMLKLAITNLTPPQFGAPRIVKAETEVNEDGKSSTLLYVSSQLDMSSIKAFENSTGYGFPIIVRSVNDRNAIYGYRLESIVQGARTADGYLYTITGGVCKDPSCNDIMPLASGDSLSFNVERENFTFTYPFTSGNYEAFALNDPSKYIKNSIGKEATIISMGENKTMRVPEDLKPKPTDPKPIKPPFAAGNPENSGGNGSPRQGDNSVPSGSGGPVQGGSGAYDGRGKIPNISTVWDSKANAMVPISGVEGAKNNEDVHGFGVVGAQIPPQRAGELILTAYPNMNTAPNGYTDYVEWSKAYKDGEGEAEFFGLPPRAVSYESWWGLADPTTKAYGGGYQFVKNGFPNESSTKGNIKIAPTRCTAIIDPSKPKGERANINCLNFNMPAQQPFQLAVTVYDQLGNFVTQYRETVTEQEFRNVTQAPNYVDGNMSTLYESSQCEKANDNNYGKPTTTTTNGIVNVNVNIYPFSATGRRFGNGVYIVKVDRVDLPFTGCQIFEAGQSPNRTDLPFVRSHSEQKFGWMRSAK